MNWAEIWEVTKIVWRYVLQTLIVFDIIFALIAVFFERKIPKSVWAWILLMMAVPYVGFVLYLLAGTTLNKRRMFKDKGFDVVGVSFDKTADSWKAAIKELNMPWHHISDLQGWKCAAAPLYGINSIPANVLVDPQGTIIDLDLRGEALGKRLAELMP